MSSNITVLNSKRTEFDFSNININTDYNIIIHCATQYHILTLFKRRSAFSLTVSTNIKKALELAFPENWHKEDRIYTPGLRDVYTIGEKLGDDESWSILNYFDTKDEIHSLIY